MCVYGCLLQIVPPQTLFVGDRKSFLDVIQPCRLVLDGSYDVILVSLRPRCYNRYDCYELRLLLQSLTRLVQCTCELHVNPYWFW